MSYRARARRVPRAFTLIEVVTTMMVLAVLGVVIAQAMLSSTETYLQFRTTARLHNDLSVAMDRVVRELRSIRLDSAASDIAPDIDTVTTASIAWEGVKNLSLVGDELRLDADGSGVHVLLNDVSAFSIEAFDEDDSAMASTLSGAQCDAVQRVRVTISLSRYGRTETLRALVFLRCTMQGARS